jgi:hypothetical protein
MCGLGCHRVVYIPQDPDSSRHYDPLPLSQQISFISCTVAHSAKQSVADIQILPSDSWDPQTQLLVTPIPSKALGAVFMKHSLTSSLTVFGGSLSKPWIHSFCAPAVSPEQWSAYQPSGTESDTSQLIVTDHFQKRRILTSNISVKDVEIGSRREYFVIHLTLD